MMNKLHLILAALMLAVPMAAEAQSLADVARAEDARRKTVTKPSKVYTNVDLRDDITASRATNETPTTPTPVPALNLPGGKPEPLPPQKDQAYWSGRINALTTDFTNRDDPAQRAQIELERQRSLAELDRVKKEIAEQTKAIADIEEEARKAGVPPGWLR
jgi:hypothetical protein